MDVGAMVIAALVLLTLLAPGATAAAGEAERTQAEQAFQAAVEKLKAGKAAEACPLLEESDRLDPQPGTEYELAKCYAAIGRYASAWSRFRAVAEKLDARGEHEKAEKVRQHVASTIEPKLSRLTIVVPESVSAISGVDVRRDGIPIGRPMWGTAVPLDPGAHRVRVSAPGEQAWESSIDVSAMGASVTVTVPELRDEQPVTMGETPKPPAQPVVTPSPAPPPPLPPPAPTWPGQRKAAVAVGAIGVAGLAVGVGFGIAALGKGSAWKNAVDKDCNAAGDCKSLEVIQSIRDLESDRATFATASTIGFIAGAAAVGAGVTLWLISPPDSAPPPAAPRAAAFSLTPWAGAGTAGVLARGAF